MDEIIYNVAGLFAVKVVTSGVNTYVAMAQPTVTSTSAAVWRVFRVTDDGNGNITKAFANGNPGFCHAANNMASLTYPDYS